MNFKILILFFAGVLCASTSLVAQYDIGSNYFENNQYNLAIRHFNLEENADQNPNLVEKRMIAYYETNQLDLAKKDITKLLSFRKVPRITYYYIGKIYHSEENFSKAIEYYKEYLRKTSTLDSRRPQIIHAIKQCASGLLLKYTTAYAFVNNFGDDVNSPDDDVNILQSPNHSNKYYFSSNRPTSISKSLSNSRFSGNYSYDMYAIEEVASGWGPAITMSNHLNTTEDEVLLDFNDSGNVLLYLQGPNRYQGHIKTDTANSLGQIYSGSFDSPLHTEKGDATVYFYNDSTMIFSSLREGGYGGYDLYLTAYRNGRWMLPKNLGPKVNTPYDEICPFMTQDGLKLYYSSNNETSMGGFDVFYSVFNKKASNWETANNLGSPINSAGDDIYFSLDNSGLKAFFTSDRKSGLGGMDNYVGYLKKQELGQLAMVPEIPLLVSLYPKLTQAYGEGKEPEKSTEPVTKAPETPIKQTKEFVIEPVYVTPSEDIITPTVEQNLNIVVDLLKYYPTLVLDVWSFSNNNGIASYDLYFSAKRAEQIVKYIQSKGIDVNRVAIQAFGSSYPAVTPAPEGSRSNIANRINNRIEFRFGNVEKLPIEIFYKKPIIAQNLQDQAYINLLDKVSGLSYRVQIKKSDQIFQHQIFTQYEHPLIVKSPNETDYRYMVGFFEEYKLANRLKNAFAEYKLGEVKIIPFVNGKELKRDQIVDLATKYPDLINYIKYND